MKDRFGLILQVQILKQNNSPKAGAWASGGTLNLGRSGGGAFWNTNSCWFSFGGALVLFLEEQMQTVKNTMDQLGQKEMI